MLCGEDCDQGSRTHKCIEFSKDYHKFVREQTVLTIVQVGTNNGNDHVLKLCKENPNASIYLIEPFVIHNEEIQKNYTGISNVSIENVAITPESCDNTTLYYTEQDGPKNDSRKSYQVASIKTDHIVKHDYDPSQLESITVNALTMNQFFETRRLKTIDYLFLDIEGIDFEVLKTIDFDMFIIRHLQIEHLHLDYIELEKFMKDKGYRSTRGIDFHGFDTMFTRI